MMILRYISMEPIQILFQRKYRRMEEISMRKNLKRIITTTLVTTLTLAELGMSGITSKASEKAVISIPKVYQYTSSEQKTVSKAVKAKSGKTAATLINTLTGEAFELGVEDVLDTYYSEAGSVDGKYKSFVANVDDSASKIVEQYKTSAKDRIQQEKERKYWPDQISVKVNRDVDKNDFKKLAATVALKGRIFDTSDKNYYEATVYLKKSQNVKDELKKWKAYKFVKSSSKCEIGIDSTDGSQVISIFNDTNVKKLSIDKSSISLKAGSTSKITAKVDVSGNAGRKVVWRSSNDSVVKVYSNGKIKALKKGTATVWAISKSNTDVFKKCKVTVK